MIDCNLQTSNIIFINDNEYIIFSEFFFKLIWISNFEIIINVTEGKVLISSGSIKKKMQIIHEGYCTKISTEFDTFNKLYY